MATPLSPVISLATSVHAQPGVYAALVGSGVSTGAGIPTGWGVVRELVRRAAIAHPDTNDGGVAAWENPEAWWAEHDGSELGYSTLLERLAPTAAARQGLLAGFFEPRAGEDESEAIQPSKAHHAIAELVKRGSIRVILTTNFDRLMEHALESVGVSPQVISRPEATQGMMPLAHAPVTIIKLHGDYKDLGTRNTPEELGEYPEEWNRLLAQVFDEYGLLISGWSADWDAALVAALESSPNRRYPLYWDARSSKGGNAQRLLQLRSGTPIQAPSADDLFAELLDSVDALDRLADAPLTTAIAVARLKRYLPDSVRRIDLHDLVMRAVDDVIDHISTPYTRDEEQSALEVLDGVYSASFASMQQLSALIQTGVWHDPDGVHDQLWFDVLQRLVNAGKREVSIPNDALGKARSIPAFIALAVLGIACVSRDREQLFIRLATEVEGQTDYRGVPEAAAQALHYYSLTEKEWVQRLPRWGGQEWHFPVSRLMRTELRQHFKDAIPAQDDFEKAYDGFEFRLGLVQERTRGRRRAISGDYVGEYRWDEDMPLVEKELRRQVERGNARAWREYYGGAKELEAALIAHRGILERHRVW